MTVRELRAKALVAVANRSFTNKKTLASRASTSLLALVLGSSKELDSDFDHS